MLWIRVLFSFFAHQEATDLGKDLILQAELITALTFSLLIIRVLQRKISVLDLYSHGMIRPTLLILLCLITYCLELTGILRQLYNSGYLMHSLATCIALLLLGDLINTSFLTTEKIRASLKNLCSLQGWTSYHWGTPVILKPSYFAPPNQGLLLQMSPDSFVQSFRLRNDRIGGFLEIPLSAPAIVTMSDARLRFHTQQKQPSSVQDTEIVHTPYQGRLSEAMNSASTLSVADLQGKIIYANAAFEKLSGYEQDELLNSNYAILSSAHHPINFWTTMWEVISEGKPWHAEIKNKAKDGTYYWVDTYIFPQVDERGFLKEFLTIQNDITLTKDPTHLKTSNHNNDHHLETHRSLLHEENGTPQRLVGVCLDITPQTHEATLHESEERFKSAFEHSAIGVALVSVDGKWIKVNESLLAIVGYTEQELLTLDVHSITHPDDLDTDAAYFKKLLAGTVSTYQIEKRCLHKNGSIVWIQLNGSLVRSVNKDPFYFIIQFQNITKRRHIEMDMLTINAKLSAHTQKLQSANKELESFSYSVSHDLRAPLRIIHAYAEFLKDDVNHQLGESDKEAIQAIVENTSKMKSLIDDLLEFSHVNRLDVEENSVDIDSVVREITNELTRQETGRNFELTIHGLHPATVDLKMIRQVWINLISNALKYTRQRPITHIEIGSTKQNRETCFYIKDNGIGFNMKYADKLFGVFQRLHNSNEFEGTGVGLAIIKRIINRHGGRIWVDAQENHGATFYFTIPD